MLASFMASLVEFVEALTIVLAVGVTRGWRAALTGTGLAMLLLIAIVVVVGPALAAISIHVFQLVVGTLLLLFGLRWLNKAILRAAGCIALHDETRTYEGEVSILRRALGRPWFGIDTLGLVAAFKAVTLEGLEVVVIVIAIAAGGGEQLIGPAIVGAVAAFLLVALLGAWLHRPLARVPENLLKFGVGVLLTAFGTFWAGEGVGIEWPGADWMLLALAAAYLCIGLLLVAASRIQPRAPRSAPAMKASSHSTLRLLLSEAVGLFVDDSVLAGGALATVVFAYVLAGMEWLSPALLGFHLAVAVAVVLIAATLRRARNL
ncbi:MAG TPA: hypothetical protein VMK32_02720 [Burkholderiaceae bacterium]|nr:hypothetical protein [Burkholderiaceae bacterium]